MPTDDQRPRLHLGVDIGGTFTDLVLYDEAAADTLVELPGRHAAPLRAWVEPDPAAGEALPLDERARRILGVAPGDPVRVRVLGCTVALARACLSPEGCGASYL